MADKRLNEVAEISYGRPVSRFEREKNEGKRRRRSSPEPVFEVARILNVAALETWPLELEQLEGRELNVANVNCFAREGDVIVAMFSPFPSICVAQTDLSRKIFVPSSCAIIRTDADVLDPWYLAGYLALGAVREQVLPSLASGGRASMLNTEQLGNLIIPVPSLEAQSKLGDLTRAKRELDQGRRLQDAQERELIASIFSRTIGKEA